MKRKNYLHTKFVKFLKESEEEQNDEVIDDEVIDDAEEVIDDADEVIDELLEKYKKASKEFDDIIYGRK